MLLLVFHRRSGVIIGQSLNTKKKSTRIGERSKLCVDSYGMLIYTEEYSPYL